MERNIIVTGAAGNLGRAVVEKFKREGYRVIATVLPDSGDEVEEADDVYELDVTDEKAVAAFASSITSNMVRWTPSGLGGRIWDG